MCTLFPEKTEDKFIYIFDEIKSFCIDFQQEYAK